jgi:hypothetical protein
VDKYDIGRKSQIPKHLRESANGHGSTAPHLDDLFAAKQAFTGIPDQFQLPTNYMRAGFCVRTVI